MKTIFPTKLTGIDDIRVSPSSGLTVRELFAAIAMHAIITSEKTAFDSLLASAQAIEHADALIEALKK